MLCHSAVFLTENILNDIYQAEHPYCVSLRFFGCSVLRRMFKIIRILLCFLFFSKLKIKPKITYWASYFLPPVLIRWAWSNKLLSMTSSARFFLLPIYIWLVPPMLATYSGINFDGLMNNQLSLIHILKPGFVWALELSLKPKIKKPSACFFVRKSPSGRSNSLRFFSVLVPTLSSSRCFSIPCY